ncbi:PEP-CTERM sorting domain-containing protein [Desulfobacter postgatei]|uniref:PEP-CTERM putative exosortase interaction domain-containing protein n=1 Tax=Desulfobacter postgatei 2ac9 TaxID=879212 RepID=I5B2U0_9BACT|nr:PEP-CTERM sorting domain-containing protein [Desulfobacter postgatei]EIM63803.1 PEP-CTERM putative exosortase interaction domain-containing protein [Desulfobacter postgatei 2ac9]
MYTPYGTNFNILGDSIEQLDFASSYGVAVNANTLAGTPDDPFNFVFQSNVTGFTDINGNSAATPGINLPASPSFDQYEYTLVGSIWETYDGLGGLGASFTLANAPAGETNFIEIYADTYDAGTVQSNLNTGMGFTDGTLILRAEAVSGDGLFTITDDLNSNAVPDNQDRGIGSTKIIWKVSFFDSTYFDFGGIDLSDPTNFLYSQFDGTLNLPPPAAANSIVMWDGTDPNFFTGLADGTTQYNTNDFLFQVDAFKIFQPGVVPEPGTFFLFGLGLLGLSATARRKK